MRTIILIIFTVCLAGTCKAQYSSGVKTEINGKIHLMKITNKDSVRLILNYSDTKITFTEEIGVKIHKSLTKLLNDKTLFGRDKITNSINISRDFNTRAIKLEIYGEYRLLWPRDARKLIDKLTI